MMVTLRFQAKGPKLAKLQFREEKGEGFASLLSVLCVCVCVCVCVFGRSGGVVFLLFDPISLV